MFGGIYMKNSKEYKTSIVLFSVALVLYVISIITGLIPGLIYSVDKICMYAGFACFGLGLVYLAKAKDNNEDK